MAAESVNFIGRPLLQTMSQFSIRRMRDMFAMAKSPRRHGGSKKSRSYVVDGQDYAVSISDAGRDAEGNVLLRISFRAQFGSRSVCLVRGLTNRSFWHDYPEIEKMRSAAISITPAIICELIRLAHREGWNPNVSKSNFEFAANREVVQALANVIPTLPDKPDF